MNGPDKTLKTMYRIGAAIVAGAVLVIAAAFFLVMRNPEQSEPDVISPRIYTTAMQVPVSANPGGLLATKVPTSVPEPLKGMDSPMVCKMELAGLHDKAEKTGAGGMPILDSYDFGKNACIFDLKNMTAPGSLGKIEIFRNENTGENGITLKINSGREEDLLKWGETALLFFNSDITAEQAEASIRNAITEGTSEGILYTVKSGSDVILSDGKAESLSVIEIKSRTAGN